MVAQVKQELTSATSRVTDLDNKNKHLSKKLEDQEANLGSQLATLQDRAQQVRPCCISEQLQ